MLPEDLTLPLDLLSRLAHALAELPAETVSPELRTYLISAQVRAASLSMSLLSIQTALENRSLVQHPKDTGADRDGEALH